MKFDKFGVFVLPLVFFSCICPLKADEIVVSFSGTIGESNR